MDEQGDRPVNPDGIPVERRREDITVRHAITSGAVAGATVAAEVASNAAENKMKLWREMTAFILLCIILYILIQNFLTQFKVLQENTERRDIQRTEELREIRKEYQDSISRRLDSEHKRAEMLSAEIRSIGVRFDTMTNRLDNATNKVEMSTNEVRMIKLELEKTHKAIKDMTKK
jgi:hypothetical protein